MFLTDFDRHPKDRHRGLRVGRLRDDASRRIAAQRQAADDRITYLRTARRQARYDVEGVRLLLASVPRPRTSRLPALEPLDESVGTL